MLIILMFIRLLFIKTQRLQKVGIHQRLLLSAKITFLLGKIICLIEDDVAKKQVFAFPSAIRLDAIHSPLDFFSLHAVIIPHGIKWLRSKTNPSDEEDHSWIRHETFHSKISN